MSSTQVPDVTNNEPECFDSLDYDDWEGQFEFVGNNNNNSTIPNVTKAKNNELEDLNLDAMCTPTENSVVVIDEMTFLSVQSGEKKTSETDRHKSKMVNNRVPFAVNIEIIENDNGCENSKGEHCMNLDHILHFKNKLNNDRNSNPINGKTNGFNADLCDNLSEQVSDHIYINLNNIIVHILLKHNEAHTHFLIHGIYKV